MQEARRTTHERARTVLRLCLSSPIIVGCYTGVEESTTADVCETGDSGSPPQGEWDTDVEDWSDPGDNGDDIVMSACGVSTVLNHHCFSTPIHAVHTHDGRILVMHGDKDSRLWRPGAPPSSITWHPLAFDEEWPPSNAGTADLFCSGHSQLPDGRILFAGGNIDGSPEAGGLTDTFTFAARGAPAAGSMGDGELCPYGWGVEPNDNWRSQTDRMAFDRWYPTLTTLPDGRVLIAGGTSRVAGASALGFAPCDDDSDCDQSEVCVLDRTVCQEISNDVCPDPQVECEDDNDCTSGVCIDGQCGCADETSCYAATDTCQPDVPATLTRVLEILDPSQPLGQQITPLANEDALFPVSSGVPVYPFMFVLPNGDVLYAGAEGIGTDPLQANGQILVVDYNNIEESHWEHTLASQITGGSAAMYRPGMVLKSGGRHVGDLATEQQVATSEVIDLRGYPSGEYAEAPDEFTEVGEMAFARHFHNLTVLPDGNVLATGGNSFGNSVPTTDHFNNPCGYPTEEDDVEERDCAGIGPSAGCASVCIDWIQEDIDCSPDVHVPSPTCSLVRAVPCEDTAECDALLDGSTCESGFCNRTCSTLGELCGYTTSCGPFNPDIGRRVLESPRSSGQCGALNNACYATKFAEIWEPGCGQWNPLLEQEERHERMYHSTAMLLPDTRVISMGNGHRGGMREGTEQQYFAPEYSPAPGAVAPLARLPEFGLTLENEPSGEMPRDYLAWNGSSGLGALDVIVENDVDVRGASLVRLGSNTHGFDMDQRWVPLMTAAPPGQTSPVRVMGGFSNSLAPFEPGVAPPGYYMLFLLSEQGEPSEGIYVRVGPHVDMEYVCEASELLAILEESCTSEPDDGTCPTGEEVVVERDRPTVPSGSGLVDGFRVIAPAGLVEDHTQPNASEILALEGLCSRACSDYVRGIPGVTANCDDLGAFAAIEPAEEGYRARELIRADQRQGEDLFSSGTLSCDLVTSCHEAFDESLSNHGPRRISPAQDPLTASSEWELELAGTVGVMSTHSQGQVTADMTGEIAFSSCTEGNTDGPCPFYLGDLALELEEPLTLVLECDGISETHVLSSLSLSLAQPAFGMAEEDTFWRAFPPGALVFHATGTVDGVPFETRRPTQEAVYLRALSGWSQLQGQDGAWLEFTVPCGENENADILVWWSYTSISANERPPAAEIGVPSTVACPGTVPLTKSVSDVDGDLSSVRWFVDDVLLEEGITSLHFTSGHELRLLAKDERGAASTDVETIACQ